MKLLTIVFEYENELDRRSALFRALSKAKLHHEADFDLFPVRGIVSREMLTEWAEGAPSKYVIVLHESHAVSADFIAVMLERLRAKSLYLAEPISCSGQLPRDPAAVVLDDTYYLNRHTDIYGVAFHTGRLHDVLLAFPEADRSALYLNFRLYWSVRALSPLKTAHSYQSQVHVVNGLQPETDVTELMACLGPHSRELRIYVLRYLILFLRGLRSSKRTGVSLGTIGEIVRYFDLQELFPLLKVRDRFEMLWLTWVADRGVATLLLKHLTTADSYLQFSTAEPENPEGLLYCFRVGDESVWIRKVYLDNDVRRGAADPGEYDFYLRPITAQSTILFFDRPGQADDNAEYLYEYFLKTRPEFHNLAFALARNSPDWARLEKKGFALVEMFSKRFYELFVLSDLVVSSQLYDLESYGKTLVNSRYVYLQHGIQLNDMSDWVISKLYDVFVVTGAPESEYMERLAPREVLNSGIPRLQGLTRKPNEDKNTLLFMPTWRFGLNAVNESAFLESEYFRAVNGFLTDPDLLRYLEESSRTLQVKLHPNLKKRAHLFTFSKNVLLSSSSYRDAIEEADFVFSDYSSVLADAAFIGVPIAYYQWDADRFFEDQPYQSRLNYVDEGLGPVFTERTELVAYLTQEGYLEPSGQYEARREWFFDGVDPDQICERIVERMLSL